ncbi:Protein kinase domain-containing protein [Mycena sanguinolenta]|uniref:Protein kinase domain-containing protein n=1 Tax=Mycena sanguinolenta TaxID=230812 RepID=A0A8H7DHF8_9AGAR|nr:Protein kinase domain-containing protein [Mycena sanguinolenta]
MTQDPTRTSSGILIYETSLSFLKDACDELSSPNQSKLGEDMEVRRRIEGYILSMASDDVVGAIIDSLECRQRVLELANQLGLTNDPGLRTALRRDEERMATLLVSIFSSKSDEERVLRLKGNSAQHFLDVVQELYTARPPFSGLSETATMLKVLNGGRPERPLGPPAMSDTLWQHVTEFWVESHIARPPTHSVVRNMVWPHPDITPVATDELSSLVIVAEETKFLHDRLSMPFLDRPALRPSPSLPTSGGNSKDQQLDSWSGISVR